MMLFKLIRANIVWREQVHIIGYFYIDVVYSINVKDEIPSDIKLFSGYYIGNIVATVFPADHLTAIFMKMLSDLPSTKWPPFHRRYFQMYFRE